MQRILLMLKQVSNVAFECVVCKTYVLCNSYAHLGVKEFNNFHQLHFPQVTDQSQTRNTEHVQV